MRRAKIIALWTLGVFLLSILGAVIFLATAGDDFYRWAMQQAIEGRLDRGFVWTDPSPSTLGWSPL